MPKEQPQEYPVTVELEQRTYTGFYTVRAGVITVDSEGGELRAHAESKAELTAGRLFLQLLTGEKYRGKLDEDVG